VSRSRGFHLWQTEQNGAESYDMPSSRRGVGYHFGGMGRGLYARNAGAQRFKIYVYIQSQIQIQILPAHTCLDANKEWEYMYINFKFRSSHLSSPL